MIKQLSEPRIIYFESEQRFELEINGKKVIAFKYEKQNPQFSDYENEININEEDKKNLTDEEIEEVEEFIEEK